MSGFEKLAGLLPAVRAYSFMVAQHRNLAECHAPNLEEAKSGRWTSENSDSSFDGVEDFQVPSDFTIILAHPPVAGGVTGLVVVMSG